MNDKDTETTRGENGSIEEKELSFMREQIKQRPLNSKKLFRNTLMTVTLAIVFGVVACLIFVLLGPAFSRLLNPEPEVEPITFPEDTVTEEIPPEELYADEREIAESAEQDLMNLLDNYSFKASDYGEMHAAMRSVATEASTAIVTVTGVSGSVDWIEDLVEMSDAVSGLIVADNGTETLILADVSNLLAAERLRITFSTGFTCPGQLKVHDTVSSLGIIAVQNTALNQLTSDGKSVARLGNSLFPSLTGSAAIAVGAPAGVSGSLVYGMVTSNTRILDHADTSYTLITTNMPGNTNASGALIGVNGEVIGFLAPALTADAGDAGLLNAVGISSLKGMIEQMVNGETLPYLGIHGTDIPAEIREASGLPQGVYVSRVDMDAPALTAGIQAGDIITRYGQTEITTFAQLVTAIRDGGSGRVIRISFAREGPDGFARMSVAVTPGESTVTEE